MYKKGAPGQVRSDRLLRAPRCAYLPGSFRYSRIILPRSRPQQRLPPALRFLHHPRRTADARTRPAPSHGFGAFFGRKTPRPPRPPATAARTAITATKQDFFIDSVHSFLQLKRCFSLIFPAGDPQKDLDSSGDQRRLVAFIIPVPAQNYNRCTPIFTPRRCCGAQFGQCAGFGAVHYSKLP